jgi:hypothetical protein
LWRNSSLLTPLVESIHTLGTHIYDLHKESCSVKEDDLSFSTFSFKEQVKSHEEVSTLFLAAEKELEALIKAGILHRNAEKNASLQLEGKELLAYMKLRRSLHVLMKFLGKVYDSKL